MFFIPHVTPWLESLPRLLVVFGFVAILIGSVALGVVLISRVDKSGETAIIGVILGGVPAGIFLMAFMPLAPAYAATSVNSVAHEHSVTILWSRSSGGDGVIAPGAKFTVSVDAHNCTVSDAGGGPWSCTVHDLPAHHAFIATISLPSTPRYRTSSWHGPVKTS
jgi:hypothetical protein